MNIVQQHARVLFYLDRPRSARYDPNDGIDQALNIATLEYVEDRYNQIKSPKPEYYFQSVQRIRDDLRTIVVPDTTILFVGNLLSPLPTDYLHEIGLYLTIDGKQEISTPIDYGEKDFINENSFEKPEVEWPVHIEDQTGIRVNFGSYGTLSLVKMWYLKRPIEVFNGIKTLITNGPNVLTIGQTYYVNAGPVSHNSVIYNTGDTFVAVNTALSGTGSVFYIINSDLPEPTHDEICKRAARILSGISDNFNKRQLLDAEEKKY